MTIYLKAPDKETFHQALVDAGWAWNTEYKVELAEDGTETVTDEVIREAGAEYYTADYSLDVIGEMMLPDGTMQTITDESGNEFETPNLVTVEGYHANLLLHPRQTEATTQPGEAFASAPEVPASLQPFVIDAPTTPSRRFA